MATVYIERREWVVTPEKEEEPYLLVFNKDGEVLLFGDEETKLDTLHGQKNIEDAGFSIPEGASGAVPYLCDNSDAFRLRLMGGVFLHPDIIFHCDYRFLTKPGFAEKLESYLVGYNIQTNNEKKPVINQTWWKCNHG